MITLFVLESVNNMYDPCVYAIPLDKQVEVEKIAEMVVCNPNYVRRPLRTFEQALDANGIEYEWIGWITNQLYEERMEDWIDEKIPRALI